MDIASLVLTVSGMVLTLIGSLRAGFAVILTPERAKVLAAPYWDLNPELMAALLGQSRAMKWGLWLIAVGTSLQIAGTVLPLIRPWLSAA